MNISRYVPQGSDLAEKQKDPPCVSGPADVYKLCISIFKPRNIVLDMNIDPEEHKKLRNECLFCVVR
jgi:hypothetical protein